MPQSALHLCINNQTVLRSRLAAGHEEGSATGAQGTGSTTSSRPLTHVSVPVGRANGGFPSVSGNKRDAEGNSEIRMEAGGLGLGGGRVRAVSYEGDSHPVAHHRVGGCSHYRWSSIPIRCRCSRPLRGTRWAVTLRAAGRSGELKVGDANPRRPAAEGDSMTRTQLGSERRRQDGAPTPVQSRPPALRAPAGLRFAG